MTDLRLTPLLALAATALLAGCGPDTTGLVTLQVSEVAAMLGGDGVTVCDANTEKTRAKFGTIPGAVLLTNYRDYDPALELPAESRLVFYCHSSMCGAAVDAARKAIAAGFTDVAVMPDGIKGWASAGRPVDRPSAG